MEPVENATIISHRNMFDWQPHGCIPKIPEVQTEAAGGCESTVSTHNIYMHSLIELCSKWAKSNNWRGHVFLLNTRWRSVTFQWVNTAQILVDIAHHVINSWSQMNNRRMDNGTPFFMSCIMYTLLIVKIRCWLPLVVMLMPRDAFVAGSFCCSYLCLTPIPQCLSMQRCAS